MPGLGESAYTLSTSIKRGSVVFTKAVFLAGSLAAMFVVMAGSGLLTAQAVHGCVWGIRYTGDVKTASRALSMDKAEVAADLNLILKNEDALAAGAKARGMDESLYRIYLGQAIQRNANAAAKALGMQLDTLSSDLGRLKGDPKAMAAASEASGLFQPILAGMIDQALAMKAMGADKGIDFDWKAFLLINAGGLLLMFAVSGISFLSSCIFNLSKHSIALGAGVPLARPVRAAVPAP